MIFELLKALGENYALDAEPVHVPDEQFEPIFRRVAGHRTQVAMNVPDSESLFCHCGGRRLIAFCGHLGCKKARNHTLYDRPPIHRHGPVSYLLEKSGDCRLNAAHLR